MHRTAPSVGGAVLYRFDDGGGLRSYSTIAATPRRPGLFSTVAAALAQLARVPGALVRLVSSFQAGTVTAMRGAAFHALHALDLVRRIFSMLVPAGAGEPELAPSAGQLAAEALRASARAAELAAKEANGGKKSGGRGGRSRSK